jgi:hypothetical protein
LFSTLCKTGPVYSPPPQDGKVVEEGTHDELMEVEGLYHSLVTTQLSRAEEEELTTLPPEDQEHEDDVGLVVPEDKNNFESIKELDLPFFGKMLHLLLLFNPLQHNALLIVILFKCILFKTNFSFVYKQQLCIIACGLWGYTIYYK